MNFRYKILALTILPMLAGLTLIFLLVLNQAQSLSEKQSSVFHDALLNVRQSELVNYLDLARTAIEHVVRSDALSDEQKRSEAIRILTNLSYSDDGYFYAYTLDGVNVVHPKQPYRIGNNWWTLSDSEGKLIIQDLIARALEGGGYTRYLWEQPSSGQIGKKLGYAEHIPELDWMFGTGIYIDDIDEQVKEIDAVFAAQIKSTSYVILTIAAAAVLSVFACWLALQLNETKMADSKLQLLTKRVIDTQDEERRRVSRELHDGISQRLVAIKYVMEEAAFASQASGERRAEQVQQLMEQTQNQLDDTLHEVRRISHDLHPSILDDLGLMSAVEALVEQFRVRTGIEVSLSTVPFRNLLATDAKTALYRVTQEALTNIEKHASASRVDIKFEITRQWFRLSIQDDGVGFNHNDTRRITHANYGLGLRNMAERMSYFRGRFDIKAIAAGTLVLASIPRSSLGLQHNEAPNAA